MTLQNFIDQHSRAINEINTFWQEVMLEGKHREEAQNARQGIDFLYHSKNLPSPELILSENPLAHTLGYLSYHRGRDKSKRFYKDRDELNFINLLNGLFHKWDRLIRKEIPDFRLFDDHKEKVRRIFKKYNTLTIYVSYSDIHPLIKEHFPAPYDRVHAEIYMAIKGVLFEVLNTGIHSVDKMTGTLKDWTGPVSGNSMEMLSRISRSKYIASAIRSNQSFEMERLYVLAPVYDFFYTTGILQDQDFSVIKSLLLTGMGTMNAYEDVCLLSELPERILLNDQGELHSDSDAAVAFKNGFHLYFKNGDHFPGKWLLYPDMVEKIEVIDELDKVRRALLYSAIGPKRFAQLVGIIEIEKEISMEQQITIYHTLEMDNLLNQHLYFIGIADISGGVEDFFCIPYDLLKIKDKSRLAINDNGSLEVSIEPYLHLYTKELLLQKDDQLRRYNPYDNSLS